MSCAARFGSCSLEGERKEVVAASRLPRSENGHSEWGRVVDCDLRDLGAEMEDSDLFVGC